MPDLSEEEIRKEVLDLHTTIYNKFNYEMKYIRPPKGEFSERTLKITNSLGYKTVMWSFAYKDWEEDNQPTHEDAKSKILENVHNGEIIFKNIVEYPAPSSCADSSRLSGSPFIYVRITSILNALIIPGTT